MIPDLSKEPIDLHKNRLQKQLNNLARNPSNTKLKSILKKPQSRESIISMNNTIDPETNGLEEHRLDLIDEFDLKPNGTTKIITETLTGSLSKSVDTFTNHESVSTFANIDQNVKLLDKPTFQGNWYYIDIVVDISSSLNVVPPIRRAQTAPTAVRKHDGAVQTFDQDCKLKPSSKTVGDIANASKYRDDHSASESRPASPSGYMIAYKMSSQKLHFDPGVYSDFKGIESAKVWLHKKNVVQRKPKSNTVILQKNLSSIDEDMGSSKSDSPKVGLTSISSSDNSESDDESLRRVAVRQASFTALEAQDLESTKIDLLVFDASTQTKNDYLNENKVKKVRMKVETPTDRGSTLKRNSQIQVKDTKPLKYMDTYLSTEKKKPKQLPPLTSPLFSPIKNRPISRSSSSRSSRSSSPVLSDKHKKQSKSKGKYSKIQAKILNAGSSKHNQNPQNEFQLDPYMPASWYLPYDYMSSSIPQQPMSHYNTFNLPSNAHFGAPTNQFMIDFNAPQIPSSTFYSTNHQISQSENQNQYLESLYSNQSLYSSLPLLNSQTSIYSQPNATYSQPKVPKVSKKTTNSNRLNNNPMMNNNQSCETLVYPQSKKTKSFKNTTDLSQTRPWH